MKVLLFLTVVFVCAGAGAQSKQSGAHESRIPVPGAALYCREVGRGTPMIVLHGGPDFDISYLLPELTVFPTSSTSFITTSAAVAARPIVSNLMRLPSKPKWPISMQYESIFILRRWCC
jgi:hypothetical protein